jgi:hypothetical protein
MKKILAVVAVAGALWASGATAGDGFHYDENSVRPATYFAALSNLTSTAMFSGQGERLIFSMYERDNWLRRVGFVTRPPMPDVRLVGAVYAGADPGYVLAPDFSDAGTLRWSADGFDRALEPGAQAWTLLKISSPLFNKQFNQLRQNKVGSLMMIPQARALTSVLDRRLTNGGLFAPRDATGNFGSPKAIDQAAVLWAASSMILAATNGDTDYWHQAFADLTDVDAARPLAERAFVALGTLPPRDPAARAIAIAALGRYALTDPSAREAALALARTHADALKTSVGDTLYDLSLSIYGLVEAGRLLDDTSYLTAAMALFDTQLLPRWREAAGVFVAPDGTGTYTPDDAGAVIAALNAVRWYGRADQAARASMMYPAFFENAIVRSGLLLASPLGLVGAKYLQDQPVENFALPSLPDPARAGLAPVFAAEVAYDGEVWTVTDPRFRTGSAMFLSNMLALQTEGDADTFLSTNALAALR